MTNGQIIDSVDRRANALREAGQPLLAHALNFTLSSLLVRNAPGDRDVLERLARECDEAEVERRR